jgi:NAD(P)-dependent dehydrogenase (short-subunit alcohol dehydrogenase family)
MSKGKAAVESLKSVDGIKGQVSTVQIEVTDIQSVDAAAAKVDTDHGRVDILVNNAGVYGGDQIARDTLLNTLNVNVVGAVSVTEAFLPLLRKSSAPRLIFVTSSLASLSYTSDKTSRHYGPYATELRASKAALNMVMVEYANHPKMQGIKVLGADPGFLATNITGDPDSLRKMGATEPDVGGDVVAAIVKGEKDADVGKVAGRDGSVPW